MEVDGILTWKPRRWMEMVRVWKVARRLTERGKEEGYEEEEEKKGGR